MLYEAVEVKGNPVIYNKLTAHFAKTLFPSIAHRPSKLICKDDQHRPKIPVHLWPEHLCAEAVQTFGKLGMHTAVTPIVSYPSTMHWRGMQVVPYRLYRNYYVEFVEVISQKRYDEQYGPSVSPLVQPFEYNIGGEIMCDTRRSFLVHGGDSKTLLQLCTTVTPVRNSLPPLPPSQLSTSSSSTSITHAPPCSLEQSVVPFPLDDSKLHSTSVQIDVILSVTDETTCIILTSDVDGGEQENYICGTLESLTDRFASSGSGSGGNGQAPTHQPKQKKEKAISNTSNESRKRSLTYVAPTLPPTANVMEIACTFPAAHEDEHMNVTSSELQAPVATTLNQKPLQTISHSQVKKRLRLF